MEEPTKMEDVVRKPEQEEKKEGATQKDKSHGNNPDGSGSNSFTPESTLAQPFLGESSTERLAKNPYISSSSPSQSGEDTPPGRLRFSKSRSRSRSRSASNHKPAKHEEEIKDIAAKEPHSRPPYTSIGRFICGIGHDNKRPHHGRKNSSGSEKGTKRPRITRPGLNGPLLSYKHFMELQREQIEMQEAENCYAEYKKLHTQKQNEIFYNMHKVG